MQQCKDNTNILCNITLGWIAKNSKFGPTIFCSTKFLVTYYLWLSAFMYCKIYNLCNDGSLQKLPAKSLRTRNDKSLKLYFIFAIFLALRFLECLQNYNWIATKNFMSSILRLRAMNFIGPNLFNVTNIKAWKCIFWIIYISMSKIHSTHINQSFAANTLGNFSECFFKDIKYRISKRLLRTTS